MKLPSLASLFAPRFTSRLASRPVAPQRRTPARALLPVLLLIALAGCAGYSPQGLPPGASVADITARMGPPTGRHTLPDGTARIEYARGPFGRHTYMLDLDAQGRMTRWQQVLFENNFNAIRADETREQVLTRIGRPSNVSALGWPGKPRALWSYRYETPFCQWFQVTLDTEGKVVDTGYGPDPLCTDDGDHRRR